MIWYFRRLINAAPQAEINYSLNEGTDSRYVKIEGNTLKITRPYAGTGDYSFVLKGTLNYNGQHIEKEFPLTIADGVFGRYLCRICICVFW